MDIVFDTDRLLPLLKDFHAITNYRVGVFDVECNEILAYPVEHSGVCRLIRATPEGLDRCKKCDYNAYLCTREMRGVHAYNCHAGLVEAMAPIVGHRQTVGYLMVGQLRQDDTYPTSALDMLRETGHRLDIGEEALLSAYNRLTGTTGQVIRACAHILQACAASVWLEKYVTFQERTRVQLLEEYIDSHLQAPLTLHELAAYLGIGKTTLCSYVRDTLGMSVNDLVRGRRIDRAKTLLLEDAKPVAGVAEEVGITDYNYFTKVFKKQTGMTPSHYRKAHTKG